MRVKTVNQEIEGVIFPSSPFPTTFLQLFTACQLQESSSMGNGLFFSHAGFALSIFMIVIKFSIRKLFSTFDIVFNIITRKTLLDYCEKYPEAAVALQSWYYELLKNDFKSFNELRKVYGNASLIGDDRVVFNIMENKYRVVVRIVFAFKAIQVKWFGTHKEYDKIDGSTIKFKKKL